MRVATVRSTGALALNVAFDAMTLIRKLPSRVKDVVDAVSVDVNGGLPLSGDTLHVAPRGHPVRLRATGFVEVPRTDTVVDVEFPGCTSIVLGSAETANPTDGLFVKVKESMTPTVLSTNSYLIVVGETWNQPNPRRVMF